MKIIKTRYRGHRILISVSKRDGQDRFTTHVCNADEECFNHRLPTFQSAMGQAILFIDHLEGVTP